MTDNQQYSIKEAMIFSQKVAQLSKALWKLVEKDLQEWIKPFDLNINEYHILWLGYHLKGAAISDIAKFGIMHVSTAFNFSKKLESRGLIQFSKRQEDKRNTYIQVTETGEKVLLQLMEEYRANEVDVVKGAKALKKLYGRFPDIVEISAIVRNIYGEDFMNIQEQILQNLENDFIEENGKLLSVKKTQEVI